MQDSTPQTNPETPTSQQLPPLKGDPANTAMTLGILSIALAWALGLVGTVLGIIAISLGVQGLKKKHNKKKSIAAIITGSIGILWGVVATFLLIAIFRSLGL